MRAIAATPELAAYAADLARVFGSTTTWTPPVDARGAQLLRTRLEAVLHDVRPLADGPSLGEALRLLLEDAARGRLDKARSAKMLAEVQSLFVQAAFRRTKRAERGRLFAQLVVVFALEPALGLDARGEDAPGAQDAEAHLRRVRRALRES